MSTILILLIGLTIVIGGILAFRLHAFVALILGAVAVAVLTPSERVQRSAQLEGTLRSVIIDSESELVLSPSPINNWESHVLVAEVADSVVLQRAGQIVENVNLTEWKQENPFESTATPDGDEEKTASACYRLRISRGFKESQLALIPAGKLDAAGSLGKQNFMDRLTDALGSYCGKLAILIVAASIIGRCLLDSGAADTIVRRALQTLGEKRAPAAFMASGFTLSIPVFFDTVFYLMIPLGQALRRKTGKNYLLYVLSIVAGGTMAHSLVPPTPGPLFIAEAFNVSLGTMILGGCIVGVISSSVAMMWAYYANRRWILDLPEGANETGDSERTSPVAGTPVESTDTVESEADAYHPPTGSLPPSNAPGLIASLTPIILPVLLITLGSLVNKSGDHLAGIAVSESTAAAFKVLGNKSLALLISAAFAVLMYVKVKRPTKDDFAAAIQDAVSSAGTIILVTSAGGAFGRMMRQTSVAELLEGLPGTSPVMVVLAAFLVTAAVRTAQGSSTVAMITAAGIFGGLVTSGAAGVAPIYVALAVGCGSKPVAWMNDSGFWVITRMSGMSEKEGLKFVSPMSTLAGLAGLVAVVVAVLIFP